MDELSKNTGQAATEYLLLLVIVTLVFTTSVRILREFEVVDRLIAPISNKFVRIYQYGHEKVKCENDECEHHPRIESPRDTNFRIFMNPGGDVDE